MPGAERQAVDDRRGWGEQGRSQYLVLNERAAEGLAAGRYQDRRKSSAVTDGPRRAAPRTPPVAVRPGRRTPAPQPQRPTWDEVAEDLAALIYSERGMRPDEIADRLGVSRSTATQMILAAKRRVKR